MGNSTALPYDILDAIDYNNNNFWQLNAGTKKETKQNVSIFKFNKISKHERIGIAQRNVQKIRTIRHPYVLSYIDSMDTEESVILVTEPCTPLEIWLKKVVNDPSVPRQNLFSELTWGFKCVLKAVDFLHSNCSIIHGNLGLHSIFVTPNGDWKLGSFELACNVNSPEDLSLFIPNHFILDASYISPERQKLKDLHDQRVIDEVLKPKVPPFYIDMYSFGQCVTKAFIICQEELHGSLEKYIALALNPDIKKRPQAKKLLTTSVFNSDYIKILENIQEFSLKNPKEILEAIGQLDSLIPQMAISICNYKLLPSVNKVLQISVNDFQNRDAREGARQSIVTCIELFSKLASHKKLEESVFQQETLNIFTQLWAMTDRTVRTSLLLTLKCMADLIPPAVINKSLFDNMLAGFSDSNAKLRESTLMSLIYVVEKLDETQLQDRLVRCITNLQNDPEASIRTNACIFLGKIASKLKEPVRHRTLCNAFQKSMKDNFLHCRIAGLKTALACMKLLETTQVATKIVPQCSMLLLDKSTEVRSLAINLMDASVAKLKEYHQSLIDAEREAKEMEAGKRLNTPGHSNNSNANSSGGILGTPVTESIMNVQGWTSWLSTSTATSSNNPNDNNMNSSNNLLEPASPPPSMSQLSLHDSSDDLAHRNNSSDNLSGRVNGHKSGVVGMSLSKANNPPVAVKKGWGDDDDLDFGDNDDHDRPQQNTRQQGNPVAAATIQHSTTSILSLKKTKSNEESFQFNKPATTSNAGKGWGDNDDGLNFDDDDFDQEETKPPSIPIKPAIEHSSKPAVIGGLGLTNKDKDKEKQAGKEKAAKIAVKKLDFNKDDDWEDF